MEREKQFSSVDPALIDQVARKAVTGDIVPVEILPEYELPFGFNIEWKSVAIGVLLVLVFLGIQKL
jgi:hypothetical protein